MEAAHKDRLILHRFAAPDMPGHKGVLALDLGTGRTAWTNPDIRFLFCHEESLFAAEDVADGVMIHELDYRTGGMKNVWHNHSDALDEARAGLPQRTSEEQLFPNSVDVHDHVAGTWNAMLHEYCPLENVVGPIDVMKKEDLLIFSYHERDNDDQTGLMTQKLTIANLRRGQVVYTTILNKQVRNPVSDAFFVESEMLYFIRNKSTLVAVTLGHPRGENQ
jgi:hypothetical protein